MEKPDIAFFKKIVSICLRSLYAAAFFSLFVNLFMLVVPIYTLQLYDRVLPSSSYDSLIYLTIIAVVALLVLVLLELARTRILAHSGRWFDKEISKAALLKSPDAILQGQPYGSQVLIDINTIKQFLSTSGMVSLFDVPWIPVYLIVIFFLNSLLGLLATFGAIILFALAIWNEIATRKPLAQASNQNILSQQYIDYSLRNADTIQAMGMMPNIAKHWDYKHDPVLGFQDVANHRGAMILTLSKFFRLALQLFMLGIGAILVIQNELTSGGMIAGSILLGRALSPVEQAIAVWKSFLNTRQAFFRIKKHFLEETRTIIEMKLPTPKGELTLERVIYRVKHIEKPIINGVSVKIKAGEMVALIGPSGAGKSTLARLMVGSLKPTAGSIRLDGVDIYTWNREDFGQHVGYLPQNVELFSGAIKDNIARMGNVEDEAIIEAAVLAGVHDIILHLPKSYDTSIREGNTFALSGGQAQRIALARALYKKPCFIVLDEPNSNLDNEGEEALIRALLTMRTRFATQIIISHRASILVHVDRIIVLNDGKIQLMGPKQQVLEELQRLTKNKV